MKSKYIFATDVDGTLLMDDGNVHPDTLNAFKRAKEEGHIVVIATGRAVKRAKAILQKMPHVNYLVCNNGALVYDLEQDKPLIIHAVNPNHYPTIYDIAKKNNLFFKLHTDQDWIGWGNEGENPTPLTTELDLKIRNFINENPNEKKLFNGQIITQISIFESKNDFCKENYENFVKLFSSDSSVYLTNSFYLDVNPKNTSKWEGLVELSKKLDIPTKNIVTFGDSGNDYEMLYEAKENGFALENSHPDLVKKIKPRIGTNNTGAIGYKIIEYLEKYKKS